MPVEKMPLSRRALLSAFFPAESHATEACTPGSAERPRTLVATLASSNVCVEKQGVTCRRCAEVCDHAAIRILARQGRGVVIDAAACIGCGDCVAVCPVQAIAMLPRERVEFVSEVARLATGHG